MSRIRFEVVLSYHRDKKNIVGSQEVIIQRNVELHVCLKRTMSWLHIATLLEVAG